MKLLWGSNTLLTTSKFDRETVKAGRQDRIPIRFDGVWNKCQKFQLCSPQPELLAGSLPIPMRLLMAASTEGDQVFFGVITAVTAKFLVVNL